MTTTISIHAPLAGSDYLRSCPCYPCGHYFNPRSPRGERLPFLSGSTVFFRFQSTLPSRGATSLCIGPHSIRQISIHAPLAGSDKEPRIPLPRSWQFQSTLPSRGATRSISRHIVDIHFNPRSPRGERPEPVSANYLISRFQSTLPSRGATRHTPELLIHCAISIHAPLAGSDSVLVCDFLAVIISIHAPLAGSDYFLTSSHLLHPISIHAPLAGSDL